MKKIISMFLLVLTLTLSGSLLTQGASAKSTEPLSYRIEDFWGSSVRGAIQLEWITTIETDLWGFNVYRRSLWSTQDPYSQWVRINPEMIPAHPGSQMGYSYTLFDTRPALGVYLYQLEEILQGSTARDASTIVSY